MLAAMPERFKNSRSRLERAGQHRRAFEEEWASLFQGERTITKAMDKQHPGWWIVSLNLTPDCIARIRANQLSLRLGEFAYQLRAALDGLIWEAVTLKQGFEPAADTKHLSRLEFPLSPEWKAKDVNEGRFHGLPFPQKLIDWMRSIQPGTTDKPIGDPERGLQNTLEDIHDLARCDRHRRLRVVSMLPLDQKLKLTKTVPPGGSIVSYEWLECDPLNGKNDVARIQVVGPGGLLVYDLGLKPDFFSQYLRRMSNLTRGQTWGFSSTGLLQLSGW